jgi:hypothetical protein
MKVILVREKGKHVKREVRSIKNVSYEHLPGLKFFIHRTPEEDSDLPAFTLTEESTGFAVYKGNSVKVLLKNAREFFSLMILDAMENLIQRTKEKHPEIVRLMKGEGK